MNTKPYEMKQMPPPDCKPIFDNKGNHVGWRRKDANGEEWDFYPTHLGN
jgi:hypothetical protein